MYGITYQLIVYMIVVLICSKKIDKYLVEAGYTKYKGRVHL